MNLQFEIQSLKIANFEHRGKAEFLISLVIENQHLFKPGGGKPK